ncbi:DUF3043 domain-containing protein [Nocardioides houyundeii]|uniref:DUF3043 domain-containing protein n=1 Tax=Nocardioides houyundeii TaxID=2045452 RepID=UPI000C77B15A|nr:DUF3043 domain-containing protein [Nocardioides houyundeii]
MFRRSKSDSPSTTSEPVPQTAAAPERPGAKGRPTPTRKEAEAAARAKAKVPRTRKELAAAQRAARAESGQGGRGATKSGDDRQLPARDRGPMRRFVRDFVDARFSFMELMLPVMLVTLILGWSGKPYLVSTGNTLLFGALMLIVLDAFFLRFRLRRELAARFPGESTKGTTYYAIMRALQIRFMRLPKTQVKIGQTLPERYR